jgi:hypothetical protein
VVETPNDDQDDQKGHDVVVEIVQACPPEVVEISPLRGGETDERLEKEFIEHGGNRRFQSGEEEAPGDEDGEMGRPAAASEGEPTREPYRGRSADGPRQPPDGIEKEILP